MANLPALKALRGRGVRQDRHAGARRAASQALRFAASLVELVGGALLLAGFAPKRLAIGSLRRRLLSRPYYARYQSNPRNPQAFDEGLRRRGLGPRAESLIALDEKRRAAILALQTAQERRNAISKQIGVAMARKDSVAADDYRAEVAGLKATMPELEAAEREAGAALDLELAAIPNLPLADTPDGKDENDNIELRQHGSPPAFPEGFEPEEHFQIGERLASWISTPHPKCQALASSC